MSWVFFVHTVSSARYVIWSLFLSKACSLFLLFWVGFFPIVPHVVSSSSETMEALREMKATRWGRAVASTLKRARN